MTTTTTTTFVAAADTLINLLNGPTPTGRASQRNHVQRVEAAFDTYDQARQALTGEAPGEDEGEKWYNDVPASFPTEVVSVVIRGDVFRLTKAE